MTDKNLFSQEPDDTTLLEDQSPDGNTEEDQARDYFNELVGDGKKFRDEKALARGKAESDAFIAQLQNELRELRTDLRARESVEELLKTVNKTPRTPNSANDSTDNQNEPDADQNTNINTNGISPEDLEKLIQRKLTEQEQTKLRESNMKNVQSRLEQEWGPNYVSQLRSTAKELGVGEQFLDNLAKEQPQAFYRLVGLSGTNNSGNPPLPLSREVSSERTQLNQSNNSRNTKNWAYYEEIRKKDSRRYHSVQVQQELWKSLNELGHEKFYNS